MSIPLVASTAANAEASQIIGTINGVIQNINSSALIGASAPTSLRNAVIGGDFGTNPWQRGTSFTTISNTLTYSADRFWAVGGASSSISISQQTGTPVPGFTAHLRFQRADANADTDAIKLGQVLTTVDSTRFQGQPFVLSFWARASSGFSAADSELDVAVATGTGTDESAVDYEAGSWTGQAAVTLYDQTGSAGSAATLTTAFQRFSFSGVIPLTSDQIGFNFAFTPVGTAATDYVELAGVQLEVMPQGGVQPTPFEWRPPSLERSLCQYFFYRLNEGQSGAAQLQGQVLTTSTAAFIVPFPVPMRRITTSSITTSTAVNGGWRATNPAGVVTGSLATATGLSLVAGSATTQSVLLNAILTQGSLTTAGQTTALVGAAGGGSISVDGEL